MRKGLNMTLADAQAHAAKHGYKLEPFRKEFGDQAAIATMENDKRKLDRKSSRGMNKTEYEFSLILEAQKIRGDVDVFTYKYEALTLHWGFDDKTGKRMRYKPDFLVRRLNLVSRVIEIKGGHIFDRDLVRFRGCRAEWQWLFDFELWQKKAGEWRRLE